MVTASIQTTVITGGVYDIALTQPVEDTVASPDTVLFTIPVHNTGNDTDVVTIQPVSDSGWQILPMIIVGGVVIYFYTSHLTKWLAGETAVADAGNALGIRTQPQTITGGQIVPER